MVNTSAAKTRSAAERRILAAAARVFRDHGYRAATVRGIARAAGILPGSLHYRFPSKEAILLDLMDLGVEHATTEIRGALAATGDRVERVRLALRVHLRLVLGPASSFAFPFLFEWRALPGRSRRRAVRLRDRYDALWSGILHEAAGTGALRPEVDLGLLRLLGLGAGNWAATWFRPGGSLDPEAIADVLFDLLLFGAAVRRPRARRRGGAS